MKKIKVEWVHLGTGNVRHTTVEITPDTDLKGFSFAPLVAVKSHTMLPFVQVLGHSEVRS